MFPKIAQRERSVVGGIKPSGSGGTNFTGIVDMPAHYGLIYQDTDPGSGGSIYFDMSISDKHLLVLTGSGTRHIGVQNMQRGQVGMLIFQQPSSSLGDILVDLVNTSWAGGAAPSPNVLTQTHSAVDFLTIIHGTLAMPHEYYLAVAMPNCL